MYDIVIIGAGTAGMSAAIYGQRAGKSTLILEERSFGGQIINTPEVENYPGIMKISGAEFASNLYEQVMALGTKIKYEKAIGIEDAGDFKIVKTDKEQYACRSVIIATGAKNRPMGLEDEERLTGAGVSYCATCDGAFFRNRSVAVIGGGNTALEDAQVLSGIAEKVYLVHRRDEFRGEEANIRLLRDKENVEFVLDSVPEKLEGEKVVSGLVVKNVKTGDLRTLPVQGVFVAIGQMPDNKAFEKVADIDRTGYVIGGEDCRTSGSGIFVAGDCRTKKVRQLATASADGAIAALAAIEHINSLNR